MPPADAHMLCGSFVMPAADTDVAVFVFLLFMMIAVVAHGGYCS